MNRHPFADRMSAVLTFVMLAGGTAAVGAALFELDRPAASAAQVAKAVQLPAVEVTGRRVAAPADDVPAVIAAAVATLPAITVTGRRDARIAAVAPVRLPAVTVTGRRADPLMTTVSSQAMRVRTNATTRCVEAAPTLSRSGRHV
jgi:hypothetical protein